MGRSFGSVRMGVKSVSERWLRTKRALRKEDQPYAERLSAMAKRHSSECFCTLDDPLEAAVFSAMIEMLKQLEKKKDVDP